MFRTFIILLFLLITLALPAHAQSRAPYTGGNTVLVKIEGTSAAYEYSSGNLLVRYNDNTHKVECVLNVNTLLPANNLSPVAIPQDIFFTSKYPELLLEIDAPDANAQVSTAAPQPDNRRARLYVHGTPLDMVIPMSYNPDRRTLVFSTTFDVLLPDYRISIPAKYIPMLTGRVIFTIRNAQWTVMAPK